MVTELELLNTYPTEQRRDAAPAAGSRLTVLSRDGRYAVCRCSCGAIKRIRADHVSSGASRSCGCLSRQVTATRNRTHGADARGKRTAEYNSWAGMNDRCHNPKSKLFPYYGGRGITVCANWRGRGSFERFLAHVGPRPNRGYSIDRIDNSRGYEPGNVRWATRTDQMLNTRRARFATIGGRTQTIKEWCRELAVSYKLVHARITIRGMAPEAALLEPRRGR